MQWDILKMFAFLQVKVYEYCSYNQTKLFLVQPLRPITLYEMNMKEALSRKTLKI